MKKNKKYKLFEHKNQDYILEDANESLDYIEMLGDALTSEEIVDLLNEQNDIICEKSTQIDFLQDENSHMRELVQENRKLKELGQELYEWDSKRSLNILRVMQNFARRYSQDSVEYNLLYELGKELPINPNNLWSKEAFKEDEING